MKELVFYGIGHSMVDYFAPNIGDDLFAKVFPQSPLHISNEEFLNILQNTNPIHKSSGGTIVNILKTLANLGDKCFFSGTTGTMPNGERDDEALFFQKELARSKVEAQLFSGQDSNGKFLALFNKNGQKAIAVSKGAAPKIEVSQINELRFAHSNCFLMEGTLLSNDALLEKITELSLRYNVPIAIDCATEQSATILAHRLPDLGQFIDIYLFANQNETATLRALLSAPQDYCKIFVEKKDAFGSVAYFEDKICSSLAAKTASTLKDFSFYDDTGAGDTFAGAFLHKVLSCEAVNDLTAEELTAETVQNALLFASEKAAEVLSRFGV